MKDNSIPLQDGRPAQAIPVVGIQGMGLLPFLKTTGIIIQPMVRLHFSAIRVIITLRVGRQHLPITQKVPTTQHRVHLPYTTTPRATTTQRLARKLCSKCKQKVPLDKAILSKLEIKPAATLYGSKGCNYCNQQGYKGRLAFCEYLHLDSGVKKLVNESASEHEVRKAAREHGMRTLREDAIIKFENGLTSLEEVLKLTAAEED